jgi:hypothetical protein
MITKFNRKSLAFSIPGLLLQIGCGAGGLVIGYTTASSGHAPAEWIGTLLQVGYWVGTIILIIGLSEYAMSKGRHPFWGVFGAASCLGFVLLLGLKDKTKRSGLQPSDFDSSIAADQAPSKPPSEDSTELPKKWTPKATAPLYWRPYSIGWWVLALCVLAFFALCFWGMF